MKLLDKALKPFRYIRNFLYVRYVQFVEMITLYMLARADKLASKMTLLKGRDFSDPYTAWMLNRTSTLVRDALVAQGKDPNYVPPPPAPPQPVEVYKPRPVFSGPPFDIGSYWVRNPSSHPVLTARKQFEEKQLKLDASKFFRQNIKFVPAVEETNDFGPTKEPEVLHVAAETEPLQVTATEEVEEGSHEEFH